MTLALLSLKIHLLFVPLLFFVIIGSGKVLKGTVLGVFSLLLLQISFFGMATLEKYLKLLVSINFITNRFGLNQADQLSLKGAIYWFFQGKIELSLIFYFWLISVFFILLVGLIFWRNNYQTVSGKKIKLYWSIVIIITLLTSPHTHYHDLSLLIIPIFFILQYLMNDHLPQKEIVKKKLSYPRIKYGVFLVIILFSAFTAYFPPLSVIAYCLLLFIIYKLMFTVNPSINP